MKPCLLDDLLIANTQFESEPYVKHFKGKQPLAACKPHFANRKKTSPPKLDAFSVYEPDQPDSSNSPPRDKEELIAVGNFGGTFFTTESKEDLK